MVWYTVYREDDLTGTLEEALKDAENYVHDEPDSVAIVYKVIPVRRVSMEHHIKVEDIIEEGANEGTSQPYGGLGVGDYVRRESGLDKGVVAGLLTKDGEECVLLQDDSGRTYRSRVNVDGFGKLIKVPRP